MRQRRRALSTGYEQQSETSVIAQSHVAGDALFTSKRERERQTDREKELEIDK
jgi:hypothetical protein